MTINNKKTARPVVRLDVLQLLAWPWGTKFPPITGFATRHDTFAHPQTSVSTYGRVRRLENPKTRTNIFGQYEASPIMVAPVKLKVVSDDRSGLMRAELETVAGTFKVVRLLRVELAFDFARSSGIDRDYVLRHGLFGKSRLIGGRMGEELRFGSRYSATFASGVTQNRPMRVT